MPLSVTSNEGVDLIKHIPLKKFIQISREIVSRLPSTELSPTIVPDEYRLGLHEFTLAAETLINIWVQIVFNQHNERDLRNELESLSFNFEFINAFIDIWKEKVGEATSHSLAKPGTSDIPEFKKLKWGILIERSTTYEPKKREIKSLLSIDTSKGRKFTKLNVEELQQLHYQLQDIQNELDRMTR